MAGIPPTLRRLAVPIEGLQSYHANPRRGDVDFIKRSLEAHGQFRPIVANKGTKTGRIGEVLAGNHTLQAARELGWHKIAVTWVNVDDAAAKRIVLVDNRANDVAGYDEAELAALLADVAPGDLASVGFEQGELDELLERVAAEALGEGFDPAPAERDGKIADVAVSVGEYRFVVARGEWVAWQNVLRAAVGFEGAEATAELRRRLGFDA